MHLYVRVYRSLFWKVNSKKATFAWLDRWTGDDMNKVGPRKMNHFPGVKEVCNKASLARHLNRMKLTFPDAYAFFPTTWLLPADRLRLKDHYVACQRRRAAEIAAARAAAAEAAARQKRKEKRLRRKKKLAALKTANAAASADSGAAGAGSDVGSGGSDASVAVARASVAGAAAAAVATATAAAAYAAPVSGGTPVTPEAARGPAPAPLSAGRTAAAAAARVGVSGRPPLPQAGSGALPKLRPRVSGGVHSERAGGSAKQRRAPLPPDAARVVGGGSSGGDSGGDEEPRAVSDECVYIAKPEGSCQGKGIVLVENPDDIPPADDITAVQVVQVYVNRPLLMGGYKFDLRLYVLVSSVYPTLRVFLHVRYVGESREQVEGGGRRIEEGGVALPCLCSASWCRCGCCCCSLCSARVLCGSAPRPT